MELDATSRSRRLGQRLNELFLGLLGLEERVTLLGGSFCVQSEPGKGTTVHADILLKETP